MKRYRWGLLVVAIAIAGCTTEDDEAPMRDLTAKGDLVGGPDLATTADLAVPDLTIAADDLPVVLEDLLSEDLTGVAPTPDLATDDLAGRDLFRADLFAADLFVADLFSADLFDNSDLLGTQSGEVCNNATVLAFATNTATRVGDSTSGYVNDYNAGAFCTGTAGPDRVYRVTVPTLKKVTLTVTPTAPYNPSLNVMLATACGVLPRDCILGINDGGAGVTETAVWTNGSSSAVNLAIVIDSASSTGTASAGTFDITATLSDLPSGEVCGNATAVSGSPMAAQTTVGYTSEYGASPLCVGSSAGDHVYSITVPDQQRLAAKVTADAGFDAAINILTATGCGVSPLVCLASEDIAGAAGVDTAVWTNTTGSSVPVLLIVDGSSVTQSGLFSLETTLSAPLAGEACGNGTTITAGALLSQTNVGYSAEHRQVNFAANCASMMSPDRVYAIDVDNGKTLSAKVTPDADFDASINLFATKAACLTTPHVCVGSADVGSEGEADTATYLNNSGAKQTVYIVVGSGYAPPESLATGTFRLDTTITP